MGGIFISYRRDDTQAWARWLHERLRRHFVDEQLFIDRVRLEPGQDFRRAIEQYIDQSDALIVVIGPQWHTPRLNEPDDFVRLEILRAIEKEVRILPVRFQGAPAPRANALPEVLRALADYNAIAIGDDNPDGDVEPLVARLKRIVDPSSQLPVPAVVHQLGRILGYLYGNRVSFARGSARWLWKVTIEAVLIAAGPMLSVLAFVIAMETRGGKDSDIGTSAAGAILIAFAVGLGVSYYRRQPIGPLDLLFQWIAFAILALPLTIWVNGFGGSDVGGAIILLLSATTSAKVLAALRNRRARK